MEWSTHMLSGVVAGYVITGDYKGALIGGIAGVIPDLDEPKSKFGKVFFPISYPLNRLFGHRTFTHSLLFMILIGIVIYAPSNSSIALATMGGILAHVIGDMLTGTVRFLYPLKIPIGIRIPHSLFTLIDRIARYSLMAIICVFILSEIGISF